MVNKFTKFIMLFVGLFITVFGLSSCEKLEPPMMSENVIVQVEELNYDLKDDVMNYTLLVHNDEIYAIKSMQVGLSIDGKAFSLDFKQNIGPQMSNIRLYGAIENPGVYSSNNAKVIFVETEFEPYINTYSYYILGGCVAALVLSVGFITFFKFVDRKKKFTTALSALLTVFGISVLIFAVAFPTCSALGRMPIHGFLYSLIGPLGAILTLTIILVHGALIHFVPEVKLEKHEAQKSNENNIPIYIREPKYMKGMKEYYVEDFDEKFEVDDKCLLNADQRLLKKVKEEKYIPHEEMSLFKALNDSKDD